MKCRYWSQIGTGLLSLVVICVALGLGNRAWAGDKDQIRVVLDTSCSMGGYSGQVPLDPHRLAKLATLLLFDLADPNLEGGFSSFKVLPFDAKWDWAADAAPPIQTAQAINPGVGGATKQQRRASLVKGLTALPYNSEDTFYYPGLAAAYEELKGTPDPIYDRRVIVLITDGRPEEKDNPARQQALDKLLASFAAHHIHLYILAFGPDANSFQGFYRELIAAAGGSPDDVQFDPTGDDMLQAMSKIFARSFGYTYEGPFGRQGRTGVELVSGGHEPERAMVVAAWNLGTSPGLSLRSPARRIPPTDPGYTLEGTGVSNHSYAMVRVLGSAEGKLEPGEYIFGANAPHNAPNVQIGVFRPTELELELVPPPGTPPGAVPKVMAKKPSGLEVQVSPKGSAGTSVPQVDVKYEVFSGHWDSKAKDFLKAEHSGTARSWRANQATGTGPPNGTIEVEFTQPHAPGQASYLGRISLEVEREGTKLGGLRREQSATVEVYPFLDLKPTNNPGQARKGAPIATGSGASAADLGPGDTGCADFYFKLIEGAPGSADGLPIFEGVTDTVNLIARIKGPLPNELTGATLTLQAPNGTPVSLDPVAASTPTLGSWKTGIDLPRSDFLGSSSAPYRVCLTPKTVTQGPPGKIEIELVLNHSPYDRYDVIGTYEFKWQLAPPHILYKLSSLFCLLASLAAIVALLWLGRYRPGLPWDLQAVVGLEPRAVRDPDALTESGRVAQTKLVRIELGPAGLREHLGFVGARELPSGSGGPVLGQVTPRNLHVYFFEPAEEVRWVRIARPETPEEREAEGILDAVGPMELEVHRTYVAETANGRWHFRLEYRR